MKNKPQGWGDIIYFFVHAPGPKALLGQVSIYFYTLEPRERAEDLITNALIAQLGEVSLKN